MQIVVKQKYAKPWSDYVGQIRKLRQRGLVIPDDGRATSFLSYADYYRFSGYCLRFERKDDAGRSRVFLPGTTFDDVVGVYQFDRNLRDVFAEALECVEIGVRASVTYFFGKANGPFGHVRADSFSKAFRTVAPQARDGKTRYEQWHEDLVEETRRSRERFIRHYEVKYVEFPDLPIWVALETCSFGTLSKMFANMKKDDMRPVASVYGLQPSVLASWLHTFVYARNVCAHHSRLWDKRLSIAPQLPPGGLWGAVRGAGNTPYAVAMALNWMLRRNAPTADFCSQWRSKLTTLVCGFRESHPGLLRHTGFPDDWESLDVWASVQ